MPRSISRITLTASLLLAALWWAAGPVLPVRAATRTVSICDESHLRSAISGAAAGDTVSFGCSGTITLTGSTNGIILFQNVTIDGTGRSVTISGGGNVGVFSVKASVNVTLKQLNFVNAIGNGFGAIFNQGTLTVSNSTFSGGRSRFGGGIRNVFGTLTITNSTFSFNSARSLFADNYGGAIDNNGGTLSVSNSTFFGNTAYGSTGVGGAIHNAGTLTVTNSTFIHNSANGSGGAIKNPGTLSVTNSTFFGNSASSGGGIYSTGTMTVANTILSGSLLAGGECAGTIPTDHGGNLADGISCRFTQPSSKNFVTGFNLDPNGLQNNGGPTQTIKLLPGSPAIAAGVSNVCNASPINGKDQRGSPRNSLYCDSGAYDTLDDADLGLAGMPANIAVNATSTAGAVVTYTTPAATNLEGNPVPATIACSPASGTTFPIGTTTVTCIASATGYTNSPVSASFTVTVNDTDLSLSGMPADITTAATGPAGAVVSYTPPTAVDEAGDSPAATVSCDHASGATFPTGATTVTCTATDADDAPGTISATFTVTVKDTDLALTGMPADITTAATDSTGAAVSYTPPTAVDEAGDSPAATVSCDHASGSTFPVGATTVTCTATDADDTNSPASASFTVTVQ